MYMYVHIDRLASMIQSYMYMYVRIQVCQCYMYMYVNFTLPAKQQSRY